MKTWTLNRQALKRFRTLHPWVFSNELAHSPKGVLPGECLQLADEQGHFLAFGYAHPNSLIAFRILSRDAAITSMDEFFLGRFQRLHALRERMGLLDVSHRFCFAENDGLPGLIIDRYFVSLGAPSSIGTSVESRQEMASVEGQVFVVQPSTAGMDLLNEQVIASLQRYVTTVAQPYGLDWTRTAVVLARDSSSRKMEGLEVIAKVAVKEISGVNLEDVGIYLQEPASGVRATILRADLIGGQKTGFFLDQRTNVQITAGFMRETLLAKKAEAAQASELSADGGPVSPGGIRVAGKNAPIRILDLCCYVGQWGVQLARVVVHLGFEVEVTFVDASQKAVEAAVANADMYGIKSVGLKCDVLNDLGRVAANHFDVVICDPPAFIKKKKDIPTGSAAYLKLNKEALRKLRQGGVFVSCSCSGLFPEEEFREMLVRAQSGLTFVARGSHSPDHPQRPEFPQGTYLKSWIGLS